MPMLVTERTASVTDRSMVRRTKGRTMGMPHQRTAVSRRAVHPPSEPARIELGSEADPEQRAELDAEIRIDPPSLRGSVCSAAYRAPFPDYQTGGWSRSSTQRQALDG
ncbi:hypothetical protein ACIRBX_12165 [Kitasatospora sp. NPDC096147]|uniref:hypothetical protein n=1 Tax=Kitasatospora sp. NPDC096147 TaxID=3364093 RepID=UPI0037F7D2A5